MDALQPVLAWLVAHTYAVVFLGSIIDAVGIPFPGRVMLVAAGAIAAGGDVSLGLVIALGTAGTILGDHAWYFAGALGADRLLRLYCRLTLGSRQCVTRTGEAFRRFGGLTIVLGRFVAGIRIFAWPVAGAHGVGYGRFLVYDLAGSILWAGGFVLLGHLLGDRWATQLERSGGLKVLVPALVLASVAVLVAARLLRRRRHGAAEAASLRRRPELRSRPVSGAARPAA